MSVGFDFTSGTLPTGAALTRASAGTCIDNTGAQVSRSTNTPRFDYDPITHALRGVLIEPAATNLIGYSNDLTQVAGTVTGVTLTATTFRETAVTSQHFSQKSVGSGMTSGQPYVWSFIAKESLASPKRYLTIRPESSFTVTFPLASIDLATGIATLNATASGGGFSVATTQLAGGNWLVEFRGGISAASGNFANIFLSDVTLLATGSFLGSATSGFDISNTQLEAGTAATSRIATTGTAATRAADVLTLNWGLLGVADQIVTARYTFDDLSTQDVPTTISGGTSTVPTNLSRSRIRTIVGLGLIVPDTFNNPAIFPILPGQTFPVTKSPIWSTKSATASSGRKRKRMMWSYPKWQFKITHDFLRDTASFPELQRLYAFFNLHAGMYGQFSFYDPNDNIVTGQPFGTGDGVTTAFQLTRTLGAGAITFVEPVQSVVPTPTVSIAGTPTTAFTISGGIITFTTAPTTGAALTWSGQFMFLVEFEQDQFDADQMMQSLWSQDGLTLLSVKS